MKLFLSSYRAGKYDDRLVEFAAGTKKIAVVTNAKDYKPKEDRKTKVDENFEYFRSIGLEPTEIDLRPYFRRPGAEKLLVGFDFIWLAGGNTFLLRRALKYTSLDNFLIEKVGSGSMMYGGESAGAIMAAPTLKGSEDENSPGYEDDPTYAPEPYDKKTLWDGLGFIDYVLVPHYKSLDIGLSIDGYIDYLRERNIPYKTITDDQVVVIDGHKEELLK